MDRGNRQQMPSCSKRTRRSSGWKKNTARKSSNVNGLPITHREAFGGRRKPPSDPPEYTQAPWNTVTISVVHHLAANNKLFNIGDLVGLLISQLQAGTANPTFHAEAIIALRVLSVDAWNSTGKFVSLAAWDYSSDSQDDVILGSWVDTGSISTYPAVGYTWPISCRQRTLSNAKSTSQRRVFTIASSIGDNIYFQCHCLWRPNAVSQTFSGQRTLDDVYNAIVSVRNNMPGITRVPPYVGPKCANTLPFTLPIPGVGRDQDVSTCRCQSPDAASGSTFEHLPCCEEATTVTSEKDALLLEIEDLKSQIANLQLASNGLQH